MKLTSRANMLTLFGSGTVMAWLLPISPTQAIGIQVSENIGHLLDYLWAQEAHLPRVLTEGIFTCLLLIGVLLYLKAAYKTIRLRPSGFIWLLSYALPFAIAIGGFTILLTLHLNAILDQETSAKLLDGFLVFAVSVAVFVAATAAMVRLR